MIIEACINGIDSAIAAQKGGADRVELCDNLHEGGTTPSLASVRLARRKLDIDLFVIIRPRGGDFLYSEDEFEIMQEDILLCKDAGADGIVSGVLKADGTVDIEKTARLVELSKPMQFTFHRAFDMTSNPSQALEDVISTGADRILTSGLAKTAYDGAARISELIKQSKGRIIIMPGAKVNEDNIRIIREITCATEFHVSLRKPEASKMVFQNDKVKMGGSDFDEFNRMITDTERISSIKHILNQNHD